MSLLAFTTDDRFRITIVKYHEANPDRKWANNYEAVATNDGVTTDLTTLGLALVEYEKDLHYSYVVFDRLRISTWEPDSVPYDPSNFVSLPLSATGDRSAEFTSPLAINICWNVTRVPLTGRFGHLFYRGCLAEEDVESPSGKATLASPVTMSGILQDAITDNSLGDYLGGGGTILDLSMINSDGTQIRPISNFNSRGVATVSFDHAWFNRTP